MGFLSCLWQNMQLLSEGRPFREYVCRKTMRDSGREIVHAMLESDGSDNNADFLTFSLESSGECSNQDAWHASLKIAATEVNFKQDLG